ncbi:MAG: hypothetical protein HC796_03715 [Synechococcaceae cyanobacterium RL_1_2]|nr:hypothetical protein [Synechococcaceae cyanobacterium RL_1_2]
MPLEYDAVNNTFTIPFNFDYTVPVINDVSLDFLNLDLGELKLSSNGKIDLSASVMGSASLVIDFAGKTLTKADGTPLKDINGNDITTFDLFVDDVELKGEVNFNLEDLEVAAKLGFLELTAGGVGSGSGIGVSASIATGLAGKQSFSRLITGEFINDFYLNVNSEASARLRRLAIGAGAPPLRFQIPWN